MVFEDSTFRPLHELSKEGQRSYDTLLVQEANRILFRHDKPLLYLLYVLSKVVHLGKIEEKLYDKYIKIQEEI